MQRENGTDGALKVFTAGATREGLAACLPGFTAESRIDVDAPTNHGHLIREFAIAGETDADVVMLPSHMTDELTQRGLASAEDAITLGTIGIGAAVRTGAAHPGVSTMAALERALRAARSIVLTEAPSGKHMDALIDRLGLRAELEERITRYDTGTMVNEHLAAGPGDGEVGFGVATEILFFRDRGVDYAGPLPEEAQMRHVYRAVRLARSERIDDVRRLFEYLERPESRAAFAATGVEREKRE